MYHPRKIANLLSKGHGKVNAVILLGAGASIPAGFPSTKDLADLVRDGDSGEESVKIATRLLFAEAERYFSKWGHPPPNYEHVYYLAKQVSDEEHFGQENPAIGAFVDQLVVDLKLWIEPDINSFGGLLRDVCERIERIVQQELACNPNGTKHLRPITECCKPAHSAHIVGIATLCHDAHVQRHLEQEGIALADGFASARSGTRRWDNAFSSTGRIPFLNLHGSVDWEYQEGILVSMPRDKNGATVDKPGILIGTFNKIMEYSQGVFLDLHYRFRNILKTTERLVICGYSFGDKGINTLILDWFYEESSTPKKVVVIDPADPDKLIEGARSAIRKQWELGFPFKDAVSFIEKPLEGVTSTEFWRQPAS